MEITLCVDTDNRQDLLNAKGLIGALLGEDSPVVQELKPEPPPMKLPLAETPVPEPAPVPLQATDDYPERDKKGDGVRWDERIHSGNHKVTTRGVWARRKNVTEALFDSVMTELQAEVTTAAQTFNPAPATAAVPPAPGSMDVAGSAPPAPAPATGVDWGVVFQRIMQGITNAEFTMEELDRSVAGKMGEGKVFSDLITGGPAVWEMVLMELGAS